MTGGIKGAIVAHASDSDYQLGIGLAVTKNGLFVPSTDKERTLVDIVRHQADFPSETFKQIITKAFESGLDEQLLSAYAKAKNLVNEIDLLMKLYL